MAFLVEDGTGLAAANSYAAVAAADTYATDRVIDSWTDADTATKQSALIKATDYIDSRYAFLGTRLGATQALSWPRTGASDRYEGYAIASNVVPPALARATMELAQKVVDGTILIEDLARAGRIASASVGPVSVSYETGEGVDVGTKFGITGLLKGLLRIESDMPATPYSGSSGDPYFTNGQFDNSGV